MRSHNRCLLCILFILPLFSACIPLPAPSTETIKDNIPLFKPIEIGESIYIHSRSALRPKYFGEPYFTMGCMLDYRDNAVDQLTNYILKINPVPGLFAIKNEEELKGESPAIKFSEPAYDMIEISESIALKERLRYVIFVTEKIETTLRLPLYIIPFGIAECSNETSLDATVWEVPSGNLIGTMTISSRGDFLGLAWVFHVVFLPHTQSKTLLLFTKEILKKLTGLSPDEKKLP
jgi:hypothetical protein